MEHNDVSGELFNNRYLVYVCYQDTVDMEDFKLRGIVGYHTKEELEEFLLAEVLSKMSIPSIAEIIHNGGPVRLHNKQDATEMYNIVVEHLNNWIEIAHTFGGNYLPPLEDMLMLDDLASHLYHHVIFTKRNTLEELLNPAGFLSTANTEQKQAPYQSYREEFIKLTPSNRLIG